MRPLRWLVYPLVLGTAVVGTPWLLSLGEGRLHETLVVAGVLAAANTTLLAIELLRPWIGEWRPSVQILRVDICHGILSAIGGGTLARMLFFGTIAWMSNTAAHYGWGIWPDHWPLAVQLVPALLISDLVVYGLHRASHRIGWLWRFHEIHHSSEGLYGLASARAHPLYVGLSIALTTAPLLVLGADPPTLAMLSTFAGLNGLLQHSNLDLRTGLLNRLFATCEVHRWHHSAQPGAQQTNFGNTLAIWDLWFGTWRLPAGRPKALGLQDSAVPPSYIAQLAHPFVPREDR